MKKTKIGALIIVIVAFSCGSFAEAFEGRLYKDDVYGFEITFPKGWMELTSPARGEKSVTFAKYDVKFPQKKTPLINVTVFAIPNPDIKTPSDLGRYLIGTWKKQEPSIQIIEGPKEVEVNHLSGIRIVSESQLREKGRREKAMLGTYSYYFINDGKIIEIAAFDDKSDLDLHLDMIEQSIHSFQLIAPGETSKTE